MKGIFSIVGQAEIDAVKRLSRSDSEQLKSDINSCDPHNIFTPAGDCRNHDKRKIICPFCGNGTGDDATPVEVDFKGDRWLYHCLRECGFQGDLLNVIAVSEHLNLHDRNDMCKALAIGANLISHPLQITSSHVVNHSSTNDDNTAEKQLPLIIADIADSQNHLDELPESDRRGLTMDTLRHFHCGFLAKWIHPKNRIENTKVSPSRRIIIPTNDGKHYHASALPADRPALKKAFHKMHAGKKSEPFNANALFSNSDLILVTEGEFDAMSIWQASKGNIAVVATLSVGGYKELLLPAIDGKKISGKKFLILFDGDDTGRQRAAEMKNALLERNVPAVAKFFFDFLSFDDKKIFGSKVDANDILRKSGDLFLNNLTNQIIKASLPEFVTNKKAVDFNSDFLAKVKEWEDLNGTINPEILKKLKKAKDYLDSLTQFTITAENAQLSKTKHALALCKFYDCFAEDNIKFFSRLHAAKEKANSVINLMKAEGDDFVAEPPQYLFDILNISVRDIKKDVEPLVTSYKKKHKAYSDELEFRKSRIEEEKRQAERDAQCKTGEKRLKELLAMPESPERNADIIAVLNQLGEWKYDKFGKPVRFKDTAENLKLLFNYDPYINKLVGFDEFQDMPVFLKQAPWRKQPCINQEWTDADNSELRIYLRENYRELANKDLIFDYFISYANKHSFHLLKDYFKKLPKWDGMARAEELFIKYLGVEDTPYAREVTMNWLTAAIARVFHPGCNYQTALVLHGAQGIGKSFILERVGGKWHVAITDRVDDPHAIDTLKLTWIGEFKEMAGMRKAEINAIKAFIELRSDTRRFAYAHFAKTIPRHCVFAITVNDEKFLSDKTGNRRYAILHCNNPQGHFVEGLTDEFIQQLWAEVFEHYNELFKDGFDENKLALSKDSRIHAEEISKQHVSGDDLEGEIESFANDTKILPEVLWSLLTKEEHRDFIKNGRLAMIDAITEFNHRRRARGGNPNDIQHDVDLITACLTPAQTKHWLRIEHKTIQGNSVDEYILYGSELRQHICAAEIFNECFGSDKRKNMTRVYEILSNLKGWHRVQKKFRDKVYGEQSNIYYRSAS